MVLSFLNDIYSAFFSASGTRPHFPTCVARNADKQLIVFPLFALKDQLEITWILINSEPIVCSKNSFRAVDIPGNLCGVSGVKVWDP